MWPFSKRNSEVVEIQVDDGHGGKVWKRVNKAEFDALTKPALAAGTAKILDGCTANILDPSGIHKEDWAIGLDISRELFEQFSVDGQVYVLMFYEAGSPVTHLMKKPHWEEFVKSYGTCNS